MKLCLNVGATYIIGEVTVRENLKIASSVLSKNRLLTHKRGYPYRQHI